MLAKYYFIGWVKFWLNSWRQVVFVQIIGWHPYSFSYSIRRVNSLINLTILNLGFSWMMHQTFENVFIYLVGMQRKTNNGIQSLQSIGNWNGFLHLKTCKSFDKKRSMKDQERLKHITTTQLPVRHFRSKSM